VVEQGTHKPLVAGSNLALGTLTRPRWRVFRFLRKLDDPSTSQLHGSGVVRDGVKPVSRGERHTDGILRDEPQLPFELLERGMRRGGREPQVRGRPCAEAGRRTAIPPQVQNPTIPRTRIWSLTTPVNRDRLLQIVITG
jgi:hypothetical protein